MSYKNTKELLKEADENIYKLEYELDIEKKNIEIVNKKCSEYENIIKKLNNILMEIENDMYNKNNELKTINQ